MLPPFSTQPHVSDASYHPITQYTHPPLDMVRRRRRRDVGILFWARSANRSDPLCSSFYVYAICMVARRIMKRKRAVRLDGSMLLSVYLCCQLYPTYRMTSHYSHSNVQNPLKSTIFTYLITPRPPTIWKTPRPPALCVLIQIHTHINETESSTLAMQPYTQRLYARWVGCVFSGVYVYMFQSRCSLAI